MTDPKTGESIQQIIQTIIDPKTGKPKQIKTPINVGNDFLMKKIYHPPSLLSCFLLLENQGYTNIEKLPKEGQKEF